MDITSENKISESLGIVSSTEKIGNGAKTKIVQKEESETTTTNLSQRSTKEQSKEITKVGSTKDDHDEDYRIVRSNLHQLVDNGKRAIENILLIAKESESPRAFEVVSQLIKTVADINKDVISLHKQMKDITGNEVNISQTTNNSIFVGSTKGLQELINSDRSKSRIVKNTTDDEVEFVDE